MSGYLKNAKYLVQVLAILASPVLLAGGGVALAQGGSWYPFESASGAFEVLMPPEVKENAGKFRVSDTRVLYSTEAAAVVDYRPFKDVTKRYIIKADQTLGAPLTTEEMEGLIEREVLTYTAHYQKLNGRIRDQQNLRIGGYPARELILTFDDPELGSQALRVAMMFSTVTKYQQVFIGPEDSIFAYQTKEFFESFDLRDGFSVVNGTFAEDWSAHVSPLEIFTVLLPPVTPPYVMTEPASSANEKADIVSLTLFDPVWSQQLFFNNFGYRFDTSVNFSEIQQVLYRNHIAKYKVDVRKLNYTKAKFGEFPVLETDFAVPPQPQLQNANYVRLRAIFFGHFAVVQEIISTYPIASSEFADKIMDVIDFHPQQGQERWQRDWQAQNVSTGTAE